MVVPPLLKDIWSNSMLWKSDCVKSMMPICPFENFGNLVARSLNEFLTKRREKKLWSASLLQLVPKVRKISSVKEANCVFKVKQCQQKHQMFVRSRPSHSRRNSVLFYAWQTLLLSLATGCHANEAEHNKSWRSWSGDCMRWSTAIFETSFWAQWQGTWQELSEAEETQRL